MGIVGHYGSTADASLVVRGIGVSVFDEESIEDGSIFGLLEDRQLVGDR